MGQDVSSQVEEAESVACPGLKCLVSESLEGQCDEDRFWLEVKSGLRTDFAKDKNVLSVEVEEYTDKVFLLRKTYHGSVLNSPEDIKMLVMYEVDQEKSLIYEEWRDPVINYIKDIRVTRVLKDPLRLEAYHQRMNQEFRRGGPLIAGQVGLILSAILKREVAVQPWIQSPTNPSPEAKSAVSEPLGSYTTYDELWENIVSNLRTQALNPFVKSMKHTLLYKDDLREIFVLDVVIDGAKLAAASTPPGTDTADKHSRLRIEVAPPVGVFSVLTSDSDTRLLMEVSYTKVLKDPLLVECWAYSGEPPNLDPVQRIITSQYIDALKERLSS